MPALGQESRSGRTVKPGTRARTATGSPGLKDLTGLRTFSGDSPHLLKTAVTLVITVPTAQEKAEAKKNEALDDEEAKKRKKTASPPDDKSGGRDDGDRK